MLLDINQHLEYFTFRFTNPRKGPSSHTPTNPSLPYRRLYACTQPPTISFTTTTLVLVLTGFLVFHLPSQPDSLCGALCPRNRSLDLLQLDLCIACPTRPLLKLDLPELWLHAFLPGIIKDMAKEPHHGEHDTLFVRVIDSVKILYVMILFQHEAQCVIAHLSFLPLVRADP